MGKTRDKKLVIRSRDIKVRNCSMNAWGRTGPVFKDRKKEAARKSCRRFKDT